MSPQKGTTTGPMGRVQSGFRIQEFPSSEAEVESQGALLATGVSRFGL